MSEVKKKVYEALGFSVITFTLIGGAIALVYGLIGELSDQGRHLLATGLVFAVVAAYLLGLQVARSHQSGIKAGLDLKLGARERVQAAAKPQPVTAPSALYRPQHDDLLPRVGAMQIIDARSGGDIVD